MKQILKRLELIKTSIEIDDYESVELQVIKLKKLLIDEEVQNILKNLQDMKYVIAFDMTTIYLKKYGATIEYIDEEFEALKLELKSIENYLQKLNNKKRESLLEIDEFNTLYSIQLGIQISAILKLKQQIAQKSIQKKRESIQDNHKQLEEITETVKGIEKTINELENLLEELNAYNEKYEEIENTYAELQEELKGLRENIIEQEEKYQKEKLEIDSFCMEYESAQIEYEEFRSNYEELKAKYKEIFELDSKKKKELKILWNKASMLCYSDIMADSLKEQANIFLEQLHVAYIKKDIETVKKIYESLENRAHIHIPSNGLVNKNVLKEKIVEFKETRSKLEEEVEVIKEDETYKIIQGIDNWNEYFKELQKELKIQLEHLATQFQEHKTNDSDNIKNKNYSKIIQSITNISFEKIRRACANLIKINEADIMTKELNEKAKLYKAIVYDALEQFMYDIKEKEMNIIDWDCGQGIGVSLVLDYIKEKQLDIKINKIILIDEDTESLNRAKTHCDVLKQNDVEIITIDMKKNIETLYKVKKGFSLNLFVNDNAIIDFNEVVLDDFCNDYFVCLSTESTKVLNNIYSTISIQHHIKIITDRKLKVGRFEKYEKIFLALNQLDKFDISEDEIPY